MAPQFVSPSAGSAITKLFTYVAAIIYAAISVQFGVCPVDTGIQLGVCDGSIGPHILITPAEPVAATPVTSIPTAVPMSTVTDPTAEVPSTPVTGTSPGSTTVTLPRPLESPVNATSWL